MGEGGGGGNMLQPFVIKRRLLYPWSGVFARGWIKLRMTLGREGRKEGRKDGRWDITFEALIVYSIERKLYLLV